MQALECKYTQLLIPIIFRALIDYGMAPRYFLMRKAIGSFATYDSNGGAVLDDKRASLEILLDFIYGRFLESI